MTARYVTVGGYQAIDPRPLAEDCQRLGLPLPFWGKANSIHCPRGCEPGSAYFLLSKANANALSASAAISIVWTTERGQTTFSGYYLREACAVTIDGDGLACYLVELQDKRAVLKLSSINRRYNCCRATPYYQDDGDEEFKFFADSLNSGALFTWAQVWSSIWGYLPSSVAGSAPSLPYTPAGTPKNLAYVGISAWEAVRQFLMAIFCTIVYDPLTGNFTVIRLGITQSGLAAALTAISARRMMDERPRQSLNATTAAATVHVAFPRQNERADGLTEPAYTVSGSSGCSNTVSGTIAVVVDTMPAIFCSSGGGVQNSSELADRAAEIASNYGADETTSQERNWIVYGGIVTTLTTGSQVSELIWRDYGDGEGIGANGMGGLVTEMHQRRHTEQMPMLPQRMPELLFLGVLGGDLERDDFASVTIWCGAVGGDEHELTCTVNAWGWLVKSGQKVETGARCVGAWINGIPYVLNTDECTVPV